MILPTGIQIENLKNLSDLELKMKFYHYESVISLLDEKKLSVGDKSEQEIKSNFNKIKLECKSRFNAAEFTIEFKNGSIISGSGKAEDSGRGLSDRFLNIM